MSENENELVSSKNTKKEILEAYNDLLSRIEEKPNQDILVKQAIKEDKKIVESASKNTVESTVKGINNLKLEVIKTFDSIANNLVKEINKLDELKKAIDIEHKYLKEVYEIKENANNLTALILAHQETKDKFDREISEAKEKWLREEEEYKYNTEITRKREQDKYKEENFRLERDMELKKLKVEEELKEREDVIASKEEELQRLTLRVENFEAELDKAVEQTESKTSERLTLNYEHNNALLNKEIEGERLLYKQELASLQSKIKEQESIINDLSKKSDQATKQVQDIAIKALESSSSKDYKNFVYEGKPEK